VLLLMLLTTLLTTLLTMPASRCYLLQRLRILHVNICSSRMLLLLALLVRVKGPVLPSETLLMQMLLLPDACAALVLLRIAMASTICTMLMRDSRTNLRL
jgi:hypothetical protein